MERSDWISSSAMKIIDHLNEGKITPIDAANTSKGIIRQFDEQINAITNLNQAIPSESTGILSGVPILVKDTFMTRKIPSTAGSSEFLDFVPEEDALVVKRIRNAGGYILGKTNTPAFAQDFQTYNEPFGVTNNPYNLKMTPGGSSGGSAASLAMRYTHLAIGSDLGGSLRIPASFCGIYSLRPTFGTLPIEGHINSPSSYSPHTKELNYLTVPGPMSTDLYGLQLLWEVMQGNIDKPNFEYTDESALTDLYFLVSPFLEGLPIDERIVASIQSTMTRLGDSGVQYDIQTIYDLTDDQSAYMGLFDIMMKQYDVDFNVSERKHDIDVLLGLKKAVEGKQEEMLDHYDAWILPVSSVLPYLHNLDHERFVRTSLGWYEFDPSINTSSSQSLNYWVANGMYCRPVSVSGFPTITLPVGMINQLPLGIQVIGKPGREFELFQVARILDRLLGERIPLPSLLL